MSDEFKPLGFTQMHACESCGGLYRTRIEAQACELRDGKPPELPSIDSIFKPVGHDGPCFDTPFGFTHSMEVEFKDVDPSVLELLTGQRVVDGRFTGESTDTYALEMWTPIKRTFWQWLRRKPVQFTRYDLPSARITKGEK